MKSHHKNLSCNTCFLLTHVPNPRMNKRIGAFLEFGKVSVICTRRKSKNIWEPEYTEVDHYIFDIDLPSSKHLLKRALVSQSYQKKALKLLRKIKPSVIYTEGLDSLMIANKYKKKDKAVKIIFEVPDLREAYIADNPNALQRIVASLERKYLKDISILVVTSMKFYDVRYSQFIDKSKVVFLPNMPERSAFDGYKKIQRDEFTIGFIGGIRYMKQMKNLVNAAKKANCKTLFAGAAVNQKDYQELVDCCRLRIFRL